MDRESILEELRENKEVLRDFGVNRIGLFGSYMRGEASEGSDIDFIVDLEENTFDDYMGLKLFLEDLFSRDVDLVIESDMRDELAYVKEDAEYVSSA